MLQDKSFYWTQAWRNVRAGYKKSVGGLCERCLAKGLYVPGDKVHHIIPLTPENVTDPNIALSYDNLQLLCSSCHKEVHTPSEKRWAVDYETGTVTSIAKD